MAALGIQEINEGTDYLKKALNLTARGQVGTAVVLGSGLSQIAQNLTPLAGSRIVPFSEIPHMPSSTVDGHSGHIIATTIGRRAVIFVAGRLHCYEGLSASQVVFPIRLLGRLGVTSVILTNASGAIADTFEPGQLMAIRDHINLASDSPLVGQNFEELGPRFVDMTVAYDPNLITLAKQCAHEVGVTMHEGVYAGVLGPAYETPAEIRMYKTLGADAVGMSTIFETIAARHMGMRVLAMCCLTNKAAGLSGKEISHQEVVENNRKLSSALAKLLDMVVTRNS